MNKTSENTVSVVHLVWLPFGTGLFNNFLSSYCKYSSGYPHELVLLFNGVTKEEEIDDYLRIIDEKKIPYQYKVHYGQAQDLEAYFWIAGQLNSTYLLFLNSYVEFMAEGWLEKYMAHVDNRVGIIGATGSWESYRSTIFKRNSWKWERSQSYSKNIRKFKLLVKALLYWQFLFPGFPNPHVRTNAFMIMRELFLSLKRWPLNNKLAAFTLESGFNSLTAQVLRKGLEAILIDRWGNKYNKKEWAASKVFKMDQQQNLLISDNQTRRYEQADQQTRNALSYEAWGKGTPLL